MIGALAARTIVGPFEPSQKQTETWSQFGENGLGVWIGNARQTPVDVVSTHAVADRAAADTLVQTAAAIVSTGAVISIQRDYGGSAIANCVALSVMPGKVTAGAGISDEVPTAGPFTFIVELKWRILLPTSY